MRKKLYHSDEHTQYTQTKEYLFSVKVLKAYAIAGIVINTHLQLHTKTRFKNTTKKTMCNFSVHTQWHTIEVVESNSFG